MNARANGIKRRKRELLKAKERKNKTKNRRAGIYGAVPRTRRRPNQNTTKKGNKKQIWRVGFGWMDGDAF
jgi:hypothetical protein